MRARTSTNAKQTTKQDNLEITLIINNQRSSFKHSNCLIIRCVRTSIPQRTSVQNSACESQVSVRASMLNDRNGLRDACPSLIVCLQINCEMPLQRCDGGFSDGQTKQITITIERIF